MDFTVLTLFPEFVEPFFQHGMIKRAVEKKLVAGKVLEIRDFSEDRHHTVDDRPYGGGCGMVMKPDVLGRAIEGAKKELPGAKVVVMTPQGKPFSQQMARDFADSGQDMILVCGRYEGIDERVYSLFADEEISVGDFVMTGGEISAMAVMDTVIRLIPGVLGNQESSGTESFSDQRIEYAHYTRPPAFRELDVPDVLMSGDHGKIEQWRMQESMKRTFLKRPDLFEKRSPTEEEKQILRSWADQLMELVNG